MRRTSTGIPGLDELIEGGYPSGSTILVSGGPGTGKTILSLQFLWHGLQRGEPGVYVTFEETPEEVKEDVKVFGWNFEEHEKRGMCKILFFDPFEVADMNALITNEIEKIHAKRVVIDSTSVFGMYLKDLYSVRKKLYKLIQSMKKTGATILITSEVDEESKRYSRFGVEEYISDGVIMLYYYADSGREEYSNLEIRKMRRTDHSRGFFPLKFTKDGLVIER